MTSHIVQASSLGSLKPDWAKSNYRASSGLDFIGLSQLWLTGQPQSESQSITEACTNGLGKVSEFFSVEIASKTTSSQVVVNDEFQGQFSVNTDKLSRINLSGISVTASYSEQVQDGKYTQSYCLYRLTRGKVEKIQRDLAKEQAHIQALITDFANQINLQNLSQARIKLALLKSQANVSPALVEELELVFAEFAKGLLSVDLVFSQHAYGQNDLVSLQLQSNQNSYVYLFVEGGQHINMIMPSPGDGFNLLKKDHAFKLPTQQQIRKGNVFRVPKFSQLVGSPQVYLVASKKRRLTRFAKPSFNRFVVSDKTGFKDFIASCRLQKDCSVKQYPLLLDDTKLNFAVQSYRLKVNNEAQDVLQQVFKTHLLTEGFEVKQNGVELGILIKHKKAFSQKLDSHMFVGELRIILINGDNKTNLVKVRFSNLYDESRTEFYLEKMLQNAAKKLMHKAQDGALSN